MRKIDGMRRNTTPWVSAGVDADGGSVWRMGQPSLKGSRSKCRRRYGRLTRWILAKNCRVGRLLRELRTPERGTPSRCVYRS